MIGMKCENSRMDEEIKEIFDGLKKIKKADDAIKKIALQKNFPGGMRSEIIL